SIKPDVTNSQQMSSMQLISSNCLCGLPYYSDGIKTEVLIDGKVIHYDAVFGGILDDKDNIINCNYKEAIKEYPIDDWIYLGTSRIYFINGVRNEDSELEYYFIRRY
ncbi:MAG: hypothetical protein AABY22_22935, partial [Nanoarchaeota archaeon]